MNLTTVEQVTAEKAAGLFKAYRDANRIRPSNFDQTMMRVYRAMSKSLRVVDLTMAFRETGLDDQGRPRLAIVRATASRCFWRKQSRGACRFTTLPFWQARGSRRAASHVVGSDTVQMPEGTFTVEQQAQLSERDLTAIVPIIPPEHRPARGLERYHILFEAEWTNVPPGDPFLLRHLCGTLFVIHAQWDLTEIERMVLGMIERTGGTR